MVDYDNGSGRSVCTELVQQARVTIRTLNCDDVGNRDGRKQDGFRKIQYFVTRTHTSSQLGKKNCNRSPLIAFNRIGGTIDHNCVIFHNVQYVDRKRDFQALPGIFVSYPGTLSLERLQRVPREYGPMFTAEISTLIFFLALLHLRKRLRYRVTWALGTDGNNTVED